jgi:serine/threonine protein kinase
MNPDEQNRPDSDLNATEFAPNPRVISDAAPERIGKYEILRELGRGSMGKVYEARHPIMRTNVAVKVIHADPAENPEDVQFKKKKLFDEARRAGILTHPNVVTIKDVDSDGETAFIVMEFVQGPTLEDWLNDDKPLKLELSLNILGQMADALDYAHSKNIIHRDVKPANVMIMDGNRVKVADFGIAKDLADPSATKAGVVMGTPYYMAPEQILAKPLDGRADQFALAVLAFRLLTGHRAFQADSITALMFQIVNAPARSPVELNKNLKPGVAGVLDKALAKDPAQRYPTCREFIDALEQAAAGAGVSARTVESPHTRKRLLYLGLPVAVTILVTIALSLNLGEEPAAAFKAPEGPNLPSQIHLRQIVIDARNKPSQQAEALRQRARGVHSQIAGGGDFAALARKFSDDAASAGKGGDLGVVSRGKLPPSIERSAFALKPLETSGVLDADGVYYIFQAAGPSGFPAPQSPRKAVIRPVERSERPARKVEPPPPPPELIETEQGPAIPRPVAR